MIQALLFDMGGTLHTVTPSPERNLAFAARLISRLSDYGIALDATPDELSTLLTENAATYKHHSLTTGMELSNVRIWNEFYLRQFHIGEERLAPISEELSFLYDYDRVTLMRRPHLKEVMQELHGMGVRLGIISNIISTSFVPHMLREYGISDLMECTVMSSEAGYRKPDARIFEIAMDRMGVTREQTGYVGDMVSRDVLGAHNAGLALNIQIRFDRLAAHDARYAGENPIKPDYFIEELDELPGIIRSVNGR